MLRLPNRWVRRMIRRQLTAQLKWQSNATDCPLCTSPAGIQQPLSVGERHGLPLRTCWCPTCNMVMFNPLPSQRLLADFYRDSYQFFHRRSAVPTERVLKREATRSQRLLASINGLLPANGRVLDIGASAGHVLLNLGSARGHDRLQLVGVEPDRQFVDYVEAHVPGVKLHCAMFEDFQTDQRFDLVLLMHTLEHIHDMGGCLDKIHRLLNEDGLLYVETPNMFQAHIAGTLPKFFLISKLYTFTALTLTKMLAKHGFVNVRLDADSDKHLFGVFRKAHHSLAFTADERVSAESQQMKRYLRRQFSCSPGRPAVAA